MTDKIQTTDCYVPVDGRKDLPLPPRSFVYQREHTGGLGIPCTIIKKEGVIVLTPAELEKIKSDAEWTAYNSGYIEGRKSTFK